MQEQYVPGDDIIDTAAVELPPEITALAEELARNVHGHWAQQRMQDGWRYGPSRDDGKREHPGLVGYERLPEAEKEYDRRTAAETLRAIIALGYQIVPPR